MTELVLAIDAGTTGVRSMLFTPTGMVVAKAYKEFENHYPSPSWVEQEATDWWASTCSTILTCLKSGSLNPEDVVGVSVTNQRETIVPIDENGAALRRAIVWQDRRTVPECEWIQQQIPVDKIYSITGLTVDPYFTAPKILWIKNNQPKVFDKTHKFLLVHDYLIYRLTGLTITDHSNASRTMLFDISKADWSPEMVDGLEIPAEKLPDACGSGTKVGELTERAAKESGLSVGTPIVAGGGDQQCAALGVGVVHRGSFKSTTGTGTFMLAFSDSMKLDPQRRVLCSRHVVPDAFVVEASMFTTGSALRWFRDQLGSVEIAAADERGIDPYEVITEGAEQIPAGSEGVLHIPHFVGAGAPYWNPHARGVFAGLALGHTRYHLMRAILEGVSYEIRTNLDVMRELGLPAKEVRVTGGAARSETWMQIQTDVLGIPVIRTEMEEATALGAAILACKGISLFKSVTEAADEMVRPIMPLTPTAENRAVYERGFKRYKHLYRAISEITWDSD
jgi:D-xylulose kinase